MHVQNTANKQKTWQICRFCWMCKCKKLLSFRGASPLDPRYRLALRAPHSQLSPHSKFRSDAPVSSSWDERPFGHQQTWAEKRGLLCTFRSELGPNLTQCGLRRRWSNSIPSGILINNYLLQSFKLVKAVRICTDTCLETLSSLVNCSVNNNLPEIGPYRN